MMKISINKNQPINEQDANYEDISLYNTSKFIYKIVMKRIYDIYYRYHEYENIDRVTMHLVHNLKQTIDKMP